MPERRIAARFGIRGEGRPADAWLLETVRWAWKFKIMAHLDIATKRRPQDGRIKTRTSEGQEVELRLSTLPTAFGEKMVMRIFDPDVVVLAVKPQVMDEVVPGYAGFVRPGTVFLSIAAGKTIDGDETFCSELLEAEGVKHVFGLALVT